RCICRSAGYGFARPQADQCRLARRPFVREGRAQLKSGRQFSAYLSDGKIPAGTDGCGTELALYRCQRNAGRRYDACRPIAVRGDLYRGLSSAQQLEPRLGVAYNLKRSNTVLRASYARVLESPFNENLIVSSTANPVIDAFFGGSSAAPIRAGQRNEFHGGFQQALGRYFVVDGDYLWKYTHDAYDFSDLLNTPIFFPIAWHNSKINGFSLLASVPNFHGFTAFMVAGHVASRFFFPQVGGLGSSS